MKEREQDILDAVADFVVVLDAAGRVVTFNRACEAFFGCGREAAAGRLVWELPGSCGVAALAEAFGELPAGRFAAEFEAEWPTRAGGRIVAWSARGVRDEAGRITSVVATGRDVTEARDSEARLRHSERHYRSIVEAAQEGIWIIDARGDTTYVNSRMAEMLGCSVGEMIGRTFYDFMDPAMRATAARNLDRRREGISEQHEFEFRRKDGRSLWTLTSTNPMFDEQGRFAGALGMFADITALKEAQSSARESQRRLEFALSAANMVAWEWEPATGSSFHLGNAELFGVPQWPDEFFHVLHPEDAPTIRDMVERLLRSPGSFAAEYRIHCKDGSTRWIRDRGVMEAGPNGTPLRMAGVSFDVSDRRAAEDTLRENEERFRIAVQNSPDLMFYQDLDLKFTWFSKAIPPYTPAGLIGKCDADVMPPEEVPRHLETKRRVLRTGIGERVDTSLEIGGREYHFETALEARRNAAGEIIGLAGYTRDVTDRKRVERELQRLNATLEERVAERTMAMQRQTQLFKLVLDHMGDGIAMADASGRFLIFNAAAERIIGQTPVEMGLADWPRHFGFFLPDGQTPFPPEQLPLRRAIRGESVDEAEVYIRNPARGGGTWMSVTARPIHDEEGRLIGGVSVIRDQTDRKFAEQALRLSERHYRELSEHNRRLVKEVDHRVRNNLSALIGLIAVMRGRARDVQSFAEAMEVRIGAMAHVHQMLAGAGWQPVGLWELIASMFETMQHLAPHPIAETINGPALVISPARVLPLAMILAEWFTNSCKYGAHTTPTGRLDVRWRVQPAGLVRLEWRETGGPPVVRPTATSVGTELVNAFATRELGGNTLTLFDADGVHHEIEFNAE